MSFGISPKDPLDYTGLKMYAVPCVQGNRDPTTSDTRFPILTVWQNKQTMDAFLLMGFNSGQADWIQLAASGSIGNVSSFTASTDNAVVRWDGITGLIVQNSGVIISDTDECTGMTMITVDNVVIDGNTVSSSTGALNLTGSNIVNVTATLGDVNITSTAAQVEVFAQTNFNLSTTTGDIEIISGDELEIHSSTDMTIHNGSGDISVTASESLILVGSSSSILRSPGNVSIQTLNAGSDISISSEGDVEISGNGQTTITEDIGNVTITSNSGSVALVASVGVTASPMLTVDNLRLDLNTLSSTSGAVNITPLSGQSLNVSLATTGDFTVNTNTLVVDTSAIAVGIGDASPDATLDITRAAAVTSGAIPYVLVEPVADTGLTASTEVPLVYLNGGAATRTWATGALTTQREVAIGRPTYAFAGSSTLTNCASLSTSVPNAGTNATFTNACGIYLPTANSAAGGGTVTNAYGIYVEDPTGAGTLNRAIYASGKVDVTGDTHIGDGTADGFRLEVREDFAGPYSATTLQDPILDVRNSHQGTATYSSIRLFARTANGGSSRWFLTSVGDNNNDGFFSIKKWTTSTTTVEYFKIETDGDTVIAEDLAVGGALSKGSGSFKIDHPLKPETHHLVHSFIEGPKADLIYRGKANLVSGRAEVNIDEVSGMTEGTFEVLCREVQSFTTNESGWDRVKSSVDGNILTIVCENANCTDSISWMVIGERKDKHMLETGWTDETGRVIVEPIKKVNNA